MLLCLLKDEISQQEYLDIYNTKVIYKKLPKKIYGFVFKYKNINLVIVNWNLSKEKKKRAILHELAHIELNHLYKKETLLEFNIENIEDEADKYINYLLNKID